MYFFFSFPLATFTVVSLTSIRNDARDYIYSLFGLDAISQRITSNNQSVYRVYPSKSCQMLLDSEEECKRINVGKRQAGGMFFL